MTDEQKASAAAWQDVEQVLQQEPNLHVLKILIADAKAADAQQIALRDHLIGILQRQVERSTVDAQQIAALQDGIEQVQMSAEIADANAVAARRGLQDAEQQIAALRAENEQMKREVKFKDELIWTSRVSDLYQATVAAEKRRKELEAQLTALQAEQAQWQREIGFSRDELSLITSAVFNRTADHIYEQPELADDKERLIRLSEKAQRLRQLAALTAQQKP